MIERVYIYDRGRKLVNDPERATDYAGPVTIETQLPGGYGSASFTVHRRIAVDWAVRGAYYVQILAGQKEIYWGQIDSLNRAIRRDGQIVTITAQGLYSIINQRRIRKWWIDNSPLERFIRPSTRYGTSTPDQDNVDFNIEKKSIVIRGGYGDVAKNANDFWQYNYNVPSGTYIRNLTALYTMRTGEGMRAAWRDVTNGDEEAFVEWNDGAEHSGALNATIDGSCNQLGFRLTLTVSDLYDENDRTKIYDIIIYCHYDSAHPNYTGPSYTTGELIIDALLASECDDEISTDFGGLIDPGYIPAGFTTQNGDFETVADVIKRALRYGDTSLNSYADFVWGIQGTSDGKARYTIKRRDTTRHDWIVNLNELIGFSDETDMSSVENYVIVRYTDSDGLTQFYTPLDDSTLKDSGSILKYGRRDSHILDIGKGASADALRYGQRYLAYKSEPQLKGSLTVTGFIRNTQGVAQPVSYVRAGDVVRIADYKGGYNIVVGHTSYNGGEITNVLTMETPSDWMAMIDAQRKNV